MPELSHSSVVSIRIVTYFYRQITADKNKLYVLYGYTMCKTCLFTTLHLAHKKNAMLLKQISSLGLSKLEYLMSCVISMAKLTAYLFTKIFHFFFWYTAEKDSHKTYVTALPWTAYKWFLYRYKQSCMCIWSHHLKSLKTRSLKYSKKSSMFFPIYGLSCTIKPITSNLTSAKVPINKVHQPWWSDSWHFQVMHTTILSHLHSAIYWVTSQMTWIHPFHLSRWNASIHFKNLVYKRPFIPLIPL